MSTIVSFVSTFHFPMELKAKHQRNIERNNLPPELCKSNLWAIKCSARMRSSFSRCVCVTVLAGVLSPAHKCLVADWSHCSRIPCAFVSVQPGWDHYLRRYSTSFTSLSPAGCCNAADGFPPPLNVSTERLTASLSVPLSLALFASTSLSLHLPPVPAARNGHRPDHCRPAQCPLSLALEDRFQQKHGMEIPFDCSVCV